MYPDGMIATLMLASALAAAVHAAETAPASARHEPSGKERFELAVQNWKETRSRRLTEQRALVKAFAEQPQIVLGLRQDWGGHLEWQAMQMSLAKSLKENQEEAVKDGIIDAARRDVHNARLDRVVAERLLLLWGNTVPSRWNSRFEKVAKVLKVPGYPFPVYPSKKEYDAFSSKDFLPVYEKAEKRMKQITLDEAAAK